MWDVQLLHNRKVSVVLDSCIRKYIFSRVELLIEVQLVMVGAVMSNPLSFISGLPECSVFLEGSFL